jgi:hypothetical protein
MIDTKQVYDAAGRAEMELSFIKKVMEDSKRVTVDNGMGFIIWGFLGVAGIIATYADHYLKMGLGSLYIWIAVFAIGIFYVIFSVYREGKRERVKTLAGNLLGSVWISCLLVSGFMLVIPLLVDKMPSQVILSIILFIIGIGYYVSNSILDYKWIKYNAYIWWLTGFINLVLKFPHSQMVYLGILLIFFQIVPGMVIYKKWKKEINVKQLNQ